MKTFKQYQLILHDFGNLAFQVIDISDEEKHLAELADRMNWLFDKAGESQYRAELLIEELYMEEE